MKRFSPLFCSVGSIGFGVASLVIYGEGLIFWLFIFASFSSTGLAAVMIGQNNKVKLTQLEPIRKFEEDLRKCDPEEAEWLRLHWGAQFGETYKHPVHPVAREVMRSLEPAPEAIKSLELEAKKKVKSSSSVKAMESECLEIAKIVTRTLERGPSHTDRRHVNTLMKRFDHLKHQIEIAIAAEIKKSIFEETKKAQKVVHGYVVTDRRRRSVSCTCGKCDRCWDLTRPPLLL